MTNRLKTFKESIHQDTLDETLQKRIESASENIKLTKEDLEKLQLQKTSKLKKNLSPNQLKLRKDREKGNTFKKIELESFRNYTIRGGGNKSESETEALQAEDKRYDATPGGMEWGTPKGTEYYKSLTPGQKDAGKECKPIDTPCDASTKVEENFLSTMSGKFPAPADRHKAGIKVPTHKFKTLSKHLKTYKPQWNKQVDHDALKKQKEHGIKPKTSILDKIKAMKKEEVVVEALDQELLDYIGKIEIHGFSESDVLGMEKEIDSYELEDFLKVGAYEDSDFEDEDTNNDGDVDIYDDLNITEVLSIQGRLKRRFAARRNRQKLKVARARALRRSSSPDRIKLRATRGARNFMYKRLLRGRDKSNLPPAEKQRLEKLIQRFQPIVSRIAVRMLPQMRKKEVERLKRRGSMKSQKAKKFRISKGGSASKYKAKKFKIKNKPTLKIKLTKKAKKKTR